MTLQSCGKRISACSPKLNSCDADARRDATRLELHEARHEFGQGAGECRVVGDPVKDQAKSGCAGKSVRANEQEIDGAKTRTIGTIAYGCVSLGVMIIGYLGFKTSM